MLELAAESGCTMLSIGFESISRSTLQSVHKHVNGRRPSPAWWRRYIPTGSWCSACSCSASTATILGFRRHCRLQHQHRMRRLRLSALTPYPGTLTWYEMKGRTASSRSTGRCTTRPTSSICQRNGADELRIGLDHAYRKFYSIPSIASRFPLRGKRHRTQWAIYNAFMRRASQTENIKFDRACDVAARNRSDAADPADQARMARGRARGRRGSRAAH